MSKKRPEDLSLCLDEKGYDFTPKWPLASDKRAWLGQLRLDSIIEAYENDQWFKNAVIDRNLNLFYDKGERCSGGPLEVIANCEGLGGLGDLCNTDTLLSVLPEVLKAVSTFNDKIRIKAQKYSGLYDEESQKHRLELLGSMVQLPQSPVEVLRGMHILKGAIESKEELYVYRGVWQPISESEVEKFLDAIVLSTSLKLGSKEIREVIRDLKRDSRNSLSIYRLYPGKDKPKDYHIVDRAGKTLDLLQAVNREGYDVEPGFRPDLYLTARIAARYDRKAPTRAIDDFLKDITAHPEEDVPVLEEWLGYNLLARQLPKHASLFMVGDGRGGRSTYYGALERMLGDWNVSHVPLNEMNDKFGPWSMLGMMANIVSDEDALPFEGTHVFRRITGGDSITINRKGLPAIKDSFMPVKIGVGFNKLPYVPEINRTPALWNRIMIIEAPFQFTDDVSEAEDATRWKKRVADKVDDLAAYQGAGLLNVAIRGLGRFLERKTFSYKYFGARNIDRYDRLAAPENEVEEFIEERCIREPERSRIAMWTPREELYAAYRGWASEKGKDRISITAFTQGMGKNGAIIGKGRREYRGIALKPL